MDAQSSCVLNLHLINSNYFECRSPLPKSNKKANPQHIYIGRVDCELNCARNVIQPLKQLPKTTLHRCPHKTTAILLACLKNYVHSSGEGGKPDASVR